MNKETKLIIKELIYVSKEINDLNKPLKDQLELDKKQDKTDNSLVTTDKTIVGAINELFQNANNGKELIANAIGDSSITKDSTFSAMSDKITEIREKNVEVKEGIVTALAKAGSKASVDDDMELLYKKIASCKRYAYATTPDAGSSFVRLSDSITVYNKTEYGENYKVSGDIVVTGDSNFLIDSATLRTDSSKWNSSSGMVNAGCYGEVIRNDEVIYTTSRASLDGASAVRFIPISIPLFEGDIVRCYVWRTNQAVSWPWVFAVGGRLVQQNDI